MNKNNNDQLRRCMLTYPGLTGMVLDVPNFHSGFLPQLALYGVFESLTRFHETCEGRIYRPIPFRLANEHQSGRNSRLKDWKSTNVSPK